LIVLFFVDAVRDKAKQIEEALQHRLRSFEEIHEAAFDLLKWVTVPSKPDDLVPDDTLFYMMSAAPVFGLEADDSTESEWLDLLQRRRARGVTGLFCYNWHSAHGIEHSALGQFAQKLVHAEYESDSSWVQKCVRAWNQYDRLFPKGHSDNPSKPLKIYLIDEPEFGMIYARHSNGEGKAIIYISSSASITGHQKGAIAFSTTDPNWLMLIKQTFESQILMNKNALLDFPNRGDAELWRDKKLYSAFQNQGDRPQEHALTYPSSTGKNGNKIRISVFQGVFPPDLGLETAQVIRALAVTLSILGRLINDGKIVTADKRKLNRILGVDVGTGTGILGLVMAQRTECPITVVATDNYRPAVENASLNFRRAAETFEELAGPLRLDGKVRKGLSADEIDRKYGAELDQRYQGPMPEEQICVLNCDLAELVRRGTDDTLMAFVFNYPAYPSPSNIFNTGGKRAGRTIVGDFLGKLYERIRPTDIILLPEITMSKGATLVSANISDIASEHQYSCVQIGRADTRSPDGYLVTVKVFALAKAAGSLDSRHHVLSLIDNKLRSERVADHELPVLH
jgi:hypothetical protein